MRPGHPRLRLGWLIAACCLLLSCQKSPPPSEAPDKTSIAEQASAKCSGSSTINDAGPADYVAGGKTFLATLKTLVGKSDKQAMAALINYPIKVDIDGRRTSIRDAAEFISAYDRIFDAERVSAITSQDPDCLFRNWQGIMIGRGEVWYDQLESGNFKIIAIN